MALPTTYNTGTATVNSNDVAVTGQNTTWATSGIQPGDVFMAAGLSVTILSVNGNTSITLADPWPGAARNAASYRIAFTPDAQRVLASTRAVLDALTNGVLYALAGLATAADKIAYFTGQGTAALTAFTSFARSLLGAADAPAARTVLQLGSAALLNTGTAGAAVGRLDTGNTWSATQTIATTYDAILALSPNIASSAVIRTLKGGNLRWQMLLGNNNTETGANSGSNFSLDRFADDGSYLGSAININRSTGLVALGTPLGIASGGLGANTAAGGRASLGLGSAALESVGVSGNAIGKLNSNNTWTGTQFFSGGATTVGINGDPNANRILGFYSNNLARWFFLVTIAETGGNVGGDLIIQRRNDDGTFLDAPLSITRSTGIVAFNSAPKLPSFTVSTLPSAAANPQGIVYVSNGTANKRQAISDGSSWRFPDGAIVS
jgi:hypothetical protein